MVAFNEQVQNIEKPKESIENQMYISSQVKSALRKLRDWEKARIVTMHYHVRCISIVQILCCTSG